MEILFFYFNSSPEFLATSFEGRVFETAALGTSVVQVQAIDRDHDKNAEIKYSILSGKMSHFNNKHLEKVFNLVLSHAT